MAGPARAARVRVINRLHTAHPSTLRSEARPTPRAPPSLRDRPPHPLANIPYPSFLVRLPTTLPSTLVRSSSSITKLALSVNTPPRSSVVRRPTPARLSTSLIPDDPHTTSHILVRHSNTIPIPIYPLAYPAHLHAQILSRLNASCWKKLHASEIIWSVNVIWNVECERRIKRRRSGS